MAWLANCLLTKHEDPSLDPNTHVEGWIEVCVWMLGSKLRWTQETPGAHWLTSLVSKQTSDPLKKSVSKHQVSGW